MKIEIDARPIQHSAFRGLGRYTSNLIENILALDKSNEYELYFDPNFAIDPFYQNLKDAPHVFGEKQPSFLDHKSVFYFRYWMKRQLSKLNYDLIHFTSQIHLPPTLPKNSIITVHDIINLALKDMFYKNNNIAHYADVRYTRNMLKTAKKIITDTEYTKNDLINILGLKEETIKVIHLGIDNHFFKEYTQEQINRTLIKYNINYDYILYYGGSEGRKNVSALISAFSEIVKAGLNIKLLIIIDINNPVGIKLIGDAKKLGLDKHIVFKNQIKDEELVMILKNARLFAMPSLYEGFGFPPLEANACGTPVASSYASSLKEVLADAAVYFDPKNINEMAKSIINILNNPDLSAGLKAKGLINAKRFSWRKCAQETVELYMDILNDKP